MNTEAPYTRYETPCTRFEAPCIRYEAPCTRYEASCIRYEAPCTLGVYLKVYFITVVSVVVASRYERQRLSCPQKVYRDGIRINMKLTYLSA